MILLQADPTAAATEAVKALEKGEFSQVLQQLISLGVEAGKSILLALLIFVVGRYAIKLINRVMGRMMERRKVEPTIQSFLKSFINVLLTILLIISRHIHLLVVACEDDGVEYLYLLHCSRDALCLDEVQQFQRWARPGRRAVSAATRST